MKEIREIFSESGISFSSLKDHWDTAPEIEETGTTFLENARIKAQWVYSQKGLWTMADDSGLEVDALNGAPGVYSARYAGADADDEKNNQLLLSKLDGLELVQRRARFRCVIVLRGPEGEFSADGTCEGKIGFLAKGTEGFGYDPLFIPDGFEKTFAQLDSKQKHEISHRGRALVALRGKLHGLI